MTQSANKFDFIQKGLLEILGNEDLAKMDKISLPAVRQLMIGNFGEQASRGLLLRAGRASFYYWLNDKTAPLGWKDPAFRLLPTRTKIKRGLEDFLTWMHHEFGLESEIHEQPKKWDLAVYGISCEGSLLNCDFFTGMVQELLSWAGGGRFYAAAEIECESVGNAKCVFSLDKLPVD